MTATAEPTAPTRNPRDVKGFLLSPPEIEPAGRIRRGWLYVHLASLLVAVAVLCWVNRDQWFFYDEWDFLTFGLTGPQAGLWAPHNQHWSTIPLLLYTPLRGIFGLSSYWPYIGELICLHLALTHVLWRVMLRAGCTSLLATTAAGMFAVFGAGSENLLWAFQIGFVGSLAAGWGAALIIDRGDKLTRRDGWAVLLLVVSLMSSGLGVPLVVLSTILALARARDLIRPLVVGGIPALVFVVWYFTVQQPPKPTWTTPADDGLRGLASYVVRGLRDSLVSASDASAVLALAVLGVVAVWGIFRIVAVIMNRPGATRNAIALAGLLCAAGFFFIGGFGRAETNASRYVYVAFAFALPGLTLALSQLARRRWIELLAFLLVVYLLVFNLQLLFSRAADEADREATIKSSVLATAHLIESGEPLLETVPEPVLSPQASTEVIRELVDAGLMPQEPVDETALARMRLALQVRVTDGASQEPGAAAPVLIGQGDAAVNTIPDPSGAGEECVQPTGAGPDPHLVVAAPGGLATMELSSATGGQFALSLVAQPPGAAPRLIPVAPGATSSVAMDLPAGTEVRLGVPATGAQVCGLG